MNDCIYRQAAIKEFESLPNCYNGFSDTYDKACIIGVLEVIAPADVEPVRHGRWMEENPLDAPDCRLIRCSECGKSFIVPMNVPYEHWIDGRNYCYSCGARMDGDKDETAEADYEWSEEEQAYIEQGYMDTQVGLPDLYMN